MQYINLLKKEMDKKGIGCEYINSCVTYAENLIKQNLPVIFDKNHLSKLLGINSSVLSYYIYYTEQFYSDFKIPKKRGGYRKIEAPSLNLKKIQRWILDNILKCFPISNYAVGFRENYSILNNAKPHTNKKIIYNIDIMDFFPSINQNDVYFIFYNKGYTSEVSYIFSKLLTFKEHLPQGAPSSPYIANLKCEKMDFSLGQLANRIGATYTRYADDMTFSSNDVEGLLSNLRIIKKIVHNNNFNLNIKKERLKYNNQKQEVTGLIVNDGIKVKRSYKKEIEKHIYYCKKYGVYEHLKRNNLEYVSFFKEYLYGMVHFVKMIEPEIGQAYLKELKEIKWSY